MIRVLDEPAQAYTVTLLGPDGRTTAFACPPGSTIDEAARTVGCRLRVVCQRAGCGACRATLIAGRVGYRSPPSTTKTRDPVTGEHRYELLCRAIPLDDVTVRPEHGWTQRAHHVWSALPRPEEQEGS